MDDYFDESDDWDEESSTIECPNCAELIYEDAEQCPNCYEYILVSSTNQNSAFVKVVVWLLIIALVLPALLLVFNMI